MVRWIVAAVAGFVVLLGVMIAAAALLPQPPSPLPTFSLGLLVGGGMAALVLRKWKRKNAPLVPHAIPHSEDELFQDVLDTLREPKTSRFSASTVLTLSLLAFVAFALAAGSDSTVSLLCLVFVLLFHELGHAAAMRAFGYSDIKIFFIPFIGAVTTGHRPAVKLWQQSVMLLAGPVPGLLLGLALLLLKPVWLLRLAPPLVPMLIAVNALNLLPAEPLDGGRLFGLLVLGGMPRARVVVSLALGATLLILLKLQTPWIIGAIAGAFVGAQILRWQAATVANRVKAAPDWDPGALPPDLTWAHPAILRRIFDETRALGASSALARASHTRRVRDRANKIKLVYEALLTRAPSAAVAVPVSLLFLIGTGSIGYAAASLSGRHEQQLAEAFRQSCTTRCEQQGDDADCAPMCACTLRTLETQLGHDELFTQLSAKQGELKPAVKERLMESRARCAGALWDKRFLRGCQAGCAQKAGSDCSQRCACALGQLRGTQTSDDEARVSSTLWLMQNLDVSPPTAAGSARMASVIQQCSTEPATPAPTAPGN